MKRAASIEALLEKSNVTFAELKRAYEASLHEKNVRGDLKVDIKNIFENLRSCLDYLAHDIFETCCASSVKPDRLYFPIRPTMTEFNQAVSHYPGLQTTNKSVYDVLEAVQPYHDPWLDHFNKLNNENKHQDLVEQTRTESRHVTVSSGGGSVSWGPGVTFGGGVRINGVPIDPRTQLPVPNNQVRTEIVVWVDFLFKENGLSVLPFIEQSLKKIEQIFRDLQKHI
ncbi:MAG: hypothetical protein HY893_03415 [Deltaproteobacteria bacterium]|nr:hypothetical protein [Deltaproteobacteria bacterium]